MSLESVYTAENQRIVGSYNGVIYLIICGKSDDALYICRADADTLGVSGYTAVAGQGEYLFYFGILFQLFDYGVLASAAADYNNLHIILLINIVIPRRADTRVRPTWESPCRKCPSPLCGIATAP